MGIKDISNRMKPRSSSRSNKIQAMAESSRPRRTEPSSAPPIRVPAVPREQAAGMRAGLAAIPLDRRAGDERSPCRPECKWLAPRPGQAGALELFKKRWSARKIGYPLR